MWRFLSKPTQRRVLDVRLQSRDPETRSLAHFVLWVIVLFVLVAGTFTLLLSPSPQLTMVPGQQQYFQSDEELVSALKKSEDPRENVLTPGYSSCASVATFTEDETSEQYCTVRVPAPGAVDTELLRQDISPIEDFYEYACGRYHNERLRGPDVMRDRTQGLLRTIVNRAPEHSKVGRFYRSCREYTDRVHEQISAEHALMERFSRHIDNKLENIDDLGTVMGFLARYDVRLPFQVSVALDPRDPHVNQPLLVLHRWGGVFRSKQSTSSRGQIIHEIIAQQFSPLENATMVSQRIREISDTILDIEVHLDNCRRTSSSMDTTQTLSEYMQRVGDLEIVSWQSFLDIAAAPFEWQDFFNTFLDDYTLGEPKELWVHTREFFQCLPWHQWTAAQWRDYLKFSVAYQLYERLDHGQGGFCFRCALPWSQSSTMSGFDTLDTSQLLVVPVHHAKQTGVEATCHYETVQHLSLLLDNYLLALSDLPGIRDLTEAVVKQVREYFVDAVQRARWLSAEGRAHLERKLQAIVVHVGAPEQWPIGRGDLDITDHFAESLMELRRYHVDQALKMLRQELPPSSLFDGSVADVNAYYHYQLNQVFLPAALLQPPVFHQDYNHTALMGTLGVVVAHEMAHALDDTGLYYNAKGRIDTLPENDHQLLLDRRECLYRQSKPTRQRAPELVASALGFHVAGRGIRGRTQKQHFYTAHAQLWCGAGGRDRVDSLVAVDPSFSATWSRGSKQEGCPLI